MTTTRKVNRRCLTDEDKIWISENAPDHTIKQMAKHLNVGGQTIRTHCNQKGIAYKTKRIDQTPKPKKEYNPEFFDIDSEDYWVA